MGDLPPSVEADLALALAHAANDDDGVAALRRAFGAVGWSFELQVVPRPRDLSPLQRALLERLGDRDLPLYQFRVPSSGPCRQRWLGIAAGGVLERDIAFELNGEQRTEPLWRAVVEAHRDGDERSLRRILDALSLGDRLRAFGEVNAAIGLGSAYWLDQKIFFDCWDAPLLRRLRDEGKDWAPRFADELLAQAASRDRSKGWWTLTADLRWPVFLALVRAGIPIEPRWDALLPLGAGDLFAPSVECVRAIPDERRTGAIIEALKSNISVVAIGLPLLDVFPSEDLARLLRKSTGGAGIPKQKILAQLEELAERHAVVRRGLTSKSKAKPKPNPKPKAERVELRCAGVLRPRAFSELTPVVQVQLQIAGRRRDGRAVGAEQRFSEEGFGPGFLEICELHDARGVHVYDALLHHADSGAVFEAGGKKIVAQVIQDGVECKTASLRDALEAALADRPRS